MTGSCVFYELGYCFFINWFFGPRRDGVSSSPLGPVTEVSDAVRLPPLELP